jgi:hypothetical protein
MKNPISMTLFQEACQFEKAKKLTLANSGIR